MHFLALLPSHFMAPPYALQWPFIYPCTRTLMRSCTVRSVGFGVLPKDAVFTLTISARTRATPTLRPSDSPPDQLSHSRHIVIVPFVSPDRNQQVTCFFPDIRSRFKMLSLHKGGCSHSSRQAAPRAASLKGNDSAPSAAPLRYFTSRCPPPTAHHQTTPPPPTAVVPVWLKTRPEA